MLDDSLKRMLRNEKLKSNRSGLEYDQWYHLKEVDGTIFSQKLSLIVLSLCWNANGLKFAIIKKRILSISSQTGWNEENKNTEKEKFTINSHFTSKKHYRY